MLLYQMTSFRHIELVGQRDREISSTVQRRLWMIDVELSLWHMERDWRDKEGSLSTTDDPLALILGSCDNVRTKPDPNSMILTKGVD